MPELGYFFKQFPDHEACIERLETARWRGIPCCPFCTATTVGRKADGSRLGRWNCHTCKSSFNVLSGTMFARTKVPLPTWFMAIALLCDPEQRLSSYQLAQALGINQKTAWYLAERVRRALAEDDELVGEIVASVGPYGAGMLHGDGDIAEVA